ncbi:DUF1521 domain-containing protein [Paraburkholderia phytofirmans]|uniref:DUF1521 domain-containing protein n=1 Tax=Paraburkholderia phytofirmans TaxID=261302 RepID=UPI0038BC5428
MQATFENRSSFSLSDMKSSYEQAVSSNHLEMIQPFRATLSASAVNSMRNATFNSTSLQQYKSTFDTAGSFQRAASNLYFEQKSSFIQTQLREGYKMFSRSDDSSCRRPGQQAGWNNTEVKDNKSTIDLGNYKLDLNKKDSSMLLTDKKSGETTKIWGDPHIDSNGTSNMFKGPLTLNLSDGTKITVGTQGKGNVSYADKLTITNGNDAYVVNGLSEKDSNPLTVQHTGNGRQLDAMTPDGYSLVANRNGKGWIDPQSGHAPTAADYKKH